MSSQGGDRQQMAYSVEKLYPKCWPGISKALQRPQFALAGGPRLSYDRLAQPHTIIHIAHLWLVLSRKMIYLQNSLRAAIEFFNRIGR
jgi:hypothetical protein